jgi:hypothetical protein
MTKYFKRFVCKGCNETIASAQNFSKEPELCVNCYKTKEAIKNNKCRECGGANPKKEYWGVCKECFDKPITKEDFNEAIMLEEMRELQGWEAVEDYLDRKKEKENEKTKKKTNKGRSRQDVKRTRSKSRGTTAK